MSDLDRRLRTLRLALQAFRFTPGRKGRVIYLEDATEVLAAGDLHGHLDNFRRLVQVANLASFPRRHLVLQEVIHGPFHYATGGDKSHQLLDLLAALKGQYPRQVHFLLGNHELAQATGRPVWKGEVDLNEVFRQGVSTAYGGGAEAVYPLYQELFRAVPLAVRTRNRVYLSHSLPSPARLAEFDPAVLEREEPTEADLAPGGAVYALVWGRDTSAGHLEAFLQKVDADLLITGHVPCDRGFEAPNDRQLILDCLGANAGYCLFPADRPLTHAELVGFVSTL